MEEGQGHSWERFREPRTFHWNLAAVIQQKLSMVKTQKGKAPKPEESVDRSNRLTVEKPEGRSPKLAETVGQTHQLVKQMLGGGSRKLGRSGEPRIRSMVGMPKGGSRRLTGTVGRTHHLMEEMLVEGFPKPGGSILPELYHSPPRSDCQECPSQWSEQASGWSEQSHSRLTAREDRPRVR